MSRLGKAGQETTLGAARGQQAGPEGRETPPHAVHGQGAVVVLTLSSSQGCGKTAEGLGLRHGSDLGGSLWF